MKKREAPEKPIRVVLADDECDIQDIVKTLLKRTNDIDLVGTCANGQKAVSMCEELRPDILLLDIRMPIMDGFEAACLVHERFPEIKILVLSSIHDYESVQIMIRNEVDGYLDKSILVKDLATAIRTTYKGEIVLARAVFQHLSGVMGESKTKDFGLTERQMEILNLMKAGLTMSEIAIELRIGKTTVKTHVEKIIRKLGVNTRSEALVFAAEKHLP